MHLLQLNRITTQLCDAAAPTLSTHAAFHVKILHEIENGDLGHRHASGILFISFSFCFFVCLCVYVHVNGRGHCNQQLTTLYGNGVELVRQDT